MAAYTNYEEFLAWREEYGYDKPSGGITWEAAYELGRCASTAHNSDYVAAKGAAAIPTTQGDEK
jgi:hypothetical protein